MKKIWLLVLPVLFLVLFPINKTNSINKQKIECLDAKISYANQKNKTYTWSEAVSNNLSLGGYTIKFNSSYLNMVTYDSAYCSLFFDTQLENYDFVIDIQATNYPIYTFTNRYQQEIFANSDVNIGGYIEYLIPEDITYINRYDFTKTSAGGDFSGDEIMDYLVSFIEPYIPPSIEIIYEVLPKEADDKSVELELKWINNEVSDNIEEYLILEHHEEDCIIIITNLQKSNNQAMLRISSCANNKIFKDITIDFGQEFLGFSSSSVSLSKDLSLEENELIISEEEIKNEILTKSKGFFGTKPIEDKEISEFSLTVTSTFIHLDGSSTAYIKNNTTYKNAYAESRINNIYSLGFVDDIVENYFPKLSFIQAKKIKSSTSLTFASTCIANFLYYGQEFNITVNLKETVDSSYLVDSLSLGVENINSNKNNIIF